MLKNISLRTVTTVVIALIGIVLMAIAVMSYLVFFQRSGNQRPSRRLVATATSWPSATANRVRETPVIRFTPTSEEDDPLVPARPSLDAPTSTDEPGSEVHPTIEPTDQPCENCHQDLRGGD